MVIVPVHTSVKAGWEQRIAGRGVVFKNKSSYDTSIKWGACDGCWPKYEFLALLNYGFLDHLQSTSVKPWYLLTLSLVVILCLLMKSILVWRSYEALQHAVVVEVQICKILVGLFQLVQDAAVVCQGRRGRSWRCLPPQKFKACNLFTPMALLCINTQRRVVEHRCKGIVL